MSCAWTSRAPRVKHRPSRDGTAGLSRMSAAAAGLFADVAVRPRNDLEPLVRDRVAADDRNAVCALLDPGLCPLDRLERLAQVLHESAVGAGLLELVGLIARILGLIGSASRVLLELLLDPRLLLSKSSARAFGVHGVDPIGNAPGACDGDVVPAQAAPFAVRPYPNVNAYPFTPGSKISERRCCDTAGRSTRR